MNPDLITACFALGLKVAEHVHGIRRAGDDKGNDAIYETVRSVAKGSLTLIDTPEELIASFPTPPTGLKVNIGPEFYEMLRRIRDDERKVAEMVLKALPN